MNKLITSRWKPWLRSVYGAGPVFGAFVARQKTSLTSRRDVHPQGQVSRAANRELDHIASLPGVAAAEVKAGGWSPTVVHTAGELKFTIIRVRPGGEVPTHYHHEVWDYFVPLQGEGVIEVTNESGGVEGYSMKMHSFMAMPPTVIHLVRNKSSEASFVFLVAQSPRTKYDFIPRCSHLC